MGTFYGLGKDKAAKGEGWAPPFISCAQDTVGLLSPLPLRLIGYGKPLPLPSMEIEILQEYEYLGILLEQSGSFVVAKKHIADQANKALFSLLRKILKLSLPFDIQIYLFNKMIKPILLYGCEVWGFGNFDILKRVHLRFYKYIFNLKNSTPSAMIYGEIGVMPLAVDIQTRLVSFWSQLIATDLSEQYKLSSIIYNVIYALHDTTGFKSQWLGNVKSLICGSMVFTKVLAILIGL